MIHDIAFLHTADVHIPTFQKLVESIDASIRVRHDVYVKLLSDAVAHGLTTKLGDQVNEAMTLAADTGAKVVVCTCSTIGGIAEKTQQANSVCSMRIDRAMADQAVKSSQRILVVAAVESTLEPTRALLDESLIKAGANPEISLQLIEGAWPLFEAGRLDEYYECIENYIKQQEGYDCTVLAQASMAPVAGKFDGREAVVLASPTLGVRVAVDCLRR